MRLALTAAALCLVAGCSAGSTPTSSGPESSGSAAGTATLKVLCPEVHASIDALIASSPDSQGVFVAQVQRLWDAADASARSSLQVLRDAAERLEKAGIGPDFYAARDGIHEAVVSVNAECAKLGSPILHAGPH